MRCGLPISSKEAATDSNLPVKKRDFKGLWISHSPGARPDIVIYYIHGGGLTMGSSHFYLEFLLTWINVLKSSSFHNPAIFALEYTLVPDESYPFQLHETLAGYNYVLSRTSGPGSVVVSGDSAGALLVLSMLLYLGTKARSEKPLFAALISPWTHLVSDKNANTASDFLDSQVLNVYGLQYAGSEDPRAPLVSPGDCEDTALWAESMPRRGVGFYYGSEEVFAPGIKELSKRLAGVGRVLCRQDEAVHAWPVAAMFLETEEAARRKGLLGISADIVEAVRCLRQIDTSG